jgi:transcriptional regulator with XRE-family HTH domain
MMRQDLSRAAIGRVMQKHRQKLGLSQSEMAKRMLISQSQLSKLENGRADLMATEWVRFCEIAGISLDSIFAREPGNLPS